MGVNLIKDKYTIILDCDLQHEVIKINQLIETIIKEKFDIVIGSRFINNSQNIKMSNKRMLESRIAIMICYLLGIKEVKDPLSGFFIIETKLLKKLKIKLILRDLRSYLQYFICIKIKFLQRKFQ